MPSRGLPSVKQEFSADGTEYVEAIRQLIQVNRELLVSVNLVEHESEEMSRSFAQVKASVAGLKTEMAALKGLAGELKESFASMAEVTDTIEEVRTTLISVKESVRELSSAVDDSSLSLGDYADQHIAVGRAVDSVAASHEQLQHVIGRTSDIAADQVAALEEMYSAADAPARALGRLSDAYDNIGVSAATARDISVSSIKAQSDALDVMLVKAAAVNAEMARVPVLAGGGGSRAFSADAAFDNIIKNAGFQDLPARIQQELRERASRGVESYTADQLLDRLGGGGSSGGGKGYGGGSGGGGSPPPPPDGGDDSDDAVRKAAEFAAEVKRMREVTLAAQAKNNAAFNSIVGNMNENVDPEILRQLRAQGNALAPRAGGLSESGEDAAAKITELAAAIKETGDAALATRVGLDSAVASMAANVATAKNNVTAGFANAVVAAAALTGGGSGSGGNWNAGFAHLAAGAAAGRIAAGGGSGAAAAGVAAGMFGGGGGGGGPGSFLATAAADEAGGSGETASATFAKVSGFVRRWYPAFHWAMMLTNELLATVGPAAVAGGAAAYVGLQGGQTAFDRIKAINAVGQSLGAYSLNETPGQALGLGDSLQQAQNMADTGVWELMGAGLNSVKAATDTASGGLGNFWQTGTNVIDMLDRFSARMTLAFKGGAGKQLAALVTGGTQDLQDFGQVLGNIGHTFLNVAPNLPGVGGDVLGTLDAATKGLEEGTGALGGIKIPGIGVSGLGALLAFEAGTRWGPAIVGGAAKGIDLLGTGAEGLLGGAGAATEGLGDILSLGSFGITGEVGGAIAAGGIGMAAAGKGIKGFLGTVPRAATTEDAAALTGVEEGDMIGGEGLAGALGASTGPVVGLAAVGALLLGKTLTYKTPTQQMVGTMQGTIGQDDFSKGSTDLISAMNQLSGTIPSAQPVGTAQEGILGKVMDLFTPAGAASATQYAVGHPKASIGDVLSEYFQGGPQGTEVRALENFGTQYNNLLGAGQQVQALAKQSGEGDISLQTAYGLLNQSGVQLATGFKGSNLTATAQQQILNAVTGYQAMHGNAGAFGSNVAAVQAEQGLSGSNLPAVNSAWDAFTSNVAGGTSAASSLYQSLAGMQTLGASLSVAKTPAETATQRAEAAHASAEAAVSASKDASNVAKALTSLSSTSGASAWAALSSTSTSSPGLIQQASTMMDWLRTAGASGNIGGSGGAISGVQMTGAAGYLTKQLLPYGKDSPAALAQIASIGQQGGIAGSVYNPGESLAENYKNISKAVDTAASSQKEYNKTVSQGTINMSDVSAQAENFGSSVGSDVVSAMENASANLPKASADMTQFAESLHRGTSSFNGQGLKSVVQDLQNAGASGESIGAIVSKSMSMHGVSQSGITSALKEVNSDIGSITSKKNSQISLSVKASTGGLAQLKAAIAATEAGSKDITIGTKADTSGVTKLKTALSGVHGDTLMVKTAADMSGINAAKAGLASVQNKTVTVTTHYVSVGSPSSVSGGALGRYLHSAGGMRLPGYGGGDTVPAMLEPGEAVVPKHLVSMVAPLLAGRVPGFASGGIVAPGMASMMQAMTGVQASAQIAAALGSGPMGGAANTLTNSLSYISGRYGSPANAAAHQAQFGWYDNGGLLMPGLTLALNTTGAPEAVMGPMSAGGGPASSQAGGPPMAFGLSAAMQQLLADLNAELKKSGLGKGLAVSILSGISAGMADSLGKEGLSKLAKNLVNQVSTEVKYAQSVAANTVSGLGFSSLDPSNGSITSQMQSYLTSIGQFSNAIGQLSAGGLNKTLLTQLISAGPSALPEAQAILGQSSSAVAASTTSSAISGLNFASIDPTQGPVAQQMGTYTSSLQSFNKDIKALSKDGLNKNLLNQLIAAGPSSDPLAQSILGAGSTGGNQVKAVNQAYTALSKAAGQFGKTAGKTEGGGGKSEISAINKLYAAITKAAASFGAKAAGAKYGGVLAPNLKSGTFVTNNVTINVTMGGGGGGGGTLTMDNSQLKKLMAEIEKKLLQQGKRNRKTGVALPGYGP